MELLWAPAADAPATHAVHVVTTLLLAAMAEYDRPVGIGTLVAVDTTIPVDVKVITAAVLSTWGTDNSAACPGP